MGTEKREAHANRVQKLKDVAEVVNQRLRQKGKEHLFAELVGKKLRIRRS